MKRAIIIQARLGSTRFPRKVLADIHGKSMLERVVYRCLASADAEGTFLALPNDQELAVYCRERKWKTFLGPEENVLLRYLLAADFYEVDIIARVTADCPLIDPAIIDLAFHIQEVTGADYADTRSAFPEGLDVEVFTTEALWRLSQEPTSARVKEHIGVGFRENSLLFHIVRCNNGLFPEHYYTLSHLSVDTPEDLEHIRWLIARLPKNFSWKDALEVEKIWQQSQ